MKEVKKFYQSYEAYAYVSGNPNLIVRLEWGYYVVYDMEVKSD
jgi:hypothetical protein